MNELSLFENLPGEKLLGQILGLDEATKNALIDRLNQERQEALNRQLSQQVETMKRVYEKQEAEIISMKENIKK
jgi:hypothetical protein